MKHQLYRKVLMMMVISKNGGAGISEYFYMQFSDI